MTASGFLWPSVREEFYRDLTQLHKRNGPWDLVFFTGDFVQKGHPEEYEALTDTLEELWKRLADLGSRPQLIAIPGNHDLQRPSSLAAISKKFEHWHDDQSVREAFWSDSDCPLRQEAIQVFSLYEKWYNEWQHRHPFSPTLSICKGYLPGDFSVSLVRCGIRIGILGLNSTFLQISGGDYHRALDLDVRQFHQACNGDGPRWAANQDIAILLTHHPADWLHPRARVTFGSDISPPGRFALHLFGHMHDPVQKFQRIGGAPTERLIQGASLFGLEHYGEDSENRIHGYSAGEMVFGTDVVNLALWPRRLTTNTGGAYQMAPDYRHVLDGNEAVQDQWAAPYVRKRSNSAPNLRPPGAAYEGKWYVNRDVEENEALSYLASPGMPAVLWGPKLIGKSSTLKHLLERVRQTDGASSTIASLNVGLISTSAFGSFKAFAEEFAYELALELGLESREISRIWESNVPPKQKLTSLLLKHLTLAVSSRTILSIDGADELLERPVCQDFFGLLRAWADRGHEPHWSKLRLLLTVSTTPAYIIRTVNISPFNLTAPIKLGDFNTRQVRKLAEMYDLKSIDHELEDLVNEVGGHPYLVRLVVYHAKIQNKTIRELINSPHFSDLFDGFLSHLRSTLLTNDLYDLVAEINRDERAHIPPPIYHRLNKAGLVCKDPTSGSLKLRYAIYKRLFGS